jgi:Fe-only nitrogenase accessory protein AnfO
MSPEIAVMVGEDRATTTLTESGEVVVFTKTLCRWEPVRRMPFFLDQNLGLANVRKSMGELKTFLGECRVFIARAVSGAIFFELEKAQCSVWEISGLPEEFLDEVWQEETESVFSEQSDACEIPVPVETTPGHYYLSIKEIQGKRPEISSKQVLQKFIQKGFYQQLIVICDHVPPWIALKSDCCGFSMHSKRIGPNEVQVTLTKDTTESCVCS